MSVDNWYVEFVNADKTKRKVMLRGKNKGEIAKICKYYRLPVTGNVINMTNRLVHSPIRLPI